MKLSEFFMEHPKVAIAFSDGVDSAYLLYAAVKYGAKVQAIRELEVLSPLRECGLTKYLFVNNLVKNW